MKVRVVRTIMELVFKTPEVFVRKWGQEEHPRNFLEAVLPVYKKDLPRM